jgi:hypothetical protein
MVTDMMENGIMTRKKVWGIIIGRMEINIMDNGREV